MDMFVIFSRIVYAVYGERATLIEIPVYLVILVITYWLETTGIEPAEPVAFIIAYTRMFFLLCGLMAVGLPPTYVIKKLYDKLTSKLPKKILFWINESRKRYPDWHEYIDCGWWLGFVPFCAWCNYYIWNSLILQGLICPISLSSIFFIQFRYLELSISPSLLLTL
jgi:hypothetical protein